MAITYRRGDTIIEVILAFAIFAMLAVGATVIMNRGLAMGQQSLERTLVRQQVDSQAELLRYARDTGGDAWDSVTSGQVATPLLDSFEECPSNPPSGSFVMVIDGEGEAAQVDRLALNPGNFRSSSYYSHVSLTDTGGPITGPKTARSEGMWVQAVAVQGGPINAYDMYIRACWNSMGASRPMQVSTIVRLYGN